MKHGSTIVNSFKFSLDNSSIKHHHSPSKMPLFDTQDRDNMDEVEDDESNSELETDSRTQSMEFNSEPSLDSQTGDDVFEVQGTYEKSVLQQKVRDVLEFLDSKHLKVIDFLDGLSWGDRACTQDPKIRTERTHLLHSQRLGEVLQRWTVAPRVKGSSKARSEGASSTMHTLATMHIGRVLDRELEDIGETLESPASADIEEETLTNTSFDTISSEMRSRMPTFWELLELCVCRSSQRKRNTSKNSEKVCRISILREKMS